MLRTVMASNILLHFFNLDHYVVSFQKFVESKRKEKGGDDVPLEKLAEEFNMSSTYFGNYILFLLFFHLYLLFCFVCPLTFCLRKVISQKYSDR